LSLLRRITFRKSCNNVRQPQELIATQHVEALSPEEIGRFLKDCTEGLSKSTRHPIKL
jgi:hypothetical protein